MPKEPGTWLIVGGVILVLVGVLFKMGLLSWFGRLPGDIRMEGENVRFYFPVTTMIVLSVALSALLYLVQKFWK